MARFTVSVLFDTWLAIAAWEYMHMPSMRLTSAKIITLPTIFDRSGSADAKSA
ncbi:MAG: hypothetical protein M5U35_06750 [Roseovarius sp.]|nr:hypothetical protein [Roseovarius sp.]